jgi:hypothetical protein
METVTSLPLTPARPMSGHAAQPKQRRRLGSSDGLSGQQRQGRAGSNGQKLAAL